MAGERSDIADASEIMTYLTSVLRGCVGDETPRVADRNAAAKQLSRMLGVENYIDAEKLRMDKEAARAEDNGILYEILRAVENV